MNILSILLGILAIGLIALIHEVGHFVFAKRAGIAVHELSLGIGPKLARFERGGTSYTIRLIPFMAYVRLEEKGEGGLEEAGIFRRFLVYIGGVAFNLATALLLLTLIGIIWGINTDKVLVGDIAPGTPAAAVLQPGDRILAVNGIEADGPQAVVDALQTNGTAEARLDLLRDGEPIVRTAVPLYDADGGRYYLGFQFAKEKLNPLESLGFSLRLLGLYVAGTGQLLADLIRGTAGAGDGLVGVVGIVALSQTFTSKVGDYLSFIAILSIGMGVLNLLPVPALDGGKILLLGLEKLRGRKLPERAETAITAIGIALLLLLLLYTTINDIRNIFGG